MRKYLPILLVLALGCLETTGLSMSSCAGPNVGGMCGTWMADSMVPGASLVLNLQVRDTTVTGNGNYSIEAGRSGVLTLSGTYRPPQIAFTLRYDSGNVSTFAGIVNRSNQLVGTMTNGSGTPIPETFSLR